MSEVSQVAQFINFWFNHSASPDNIRIICLPSDFLTKNLKAAGRKAPVEEFSIRRELWSVGEEQYTEKLVAFNQRGYDVFYFVNWIRADCSGNATNADVFKRLYFPLDLDFRLPVALGDFESELGLNFAGVVWSSKREWPRHQLLVACEGVEGSEGRDLAREFCAATGSDSVGDAKRILRLPGLINWKGAAGDVTKASRCSLLRGETGHELPVDEILAQVSKFSESDMSADLRSLRMVRTRDGGLCQGEKGEYGRWDKALESAEKGQWTAAKGSRHNALLSWGYQMSAARLTWESTERNWRFLAEKGCETPPDDDLRDFELLLRDVRKGWEKIDAELDELMSATDQDGFADESMLADESGNESTVESRSIPTRTEASEGEHPGAGTKPDLGTNGVHPPKSLPTPGTPQTAGSGKRHQLTIQYFATRIARQVLNETDAHYIEFLAQCINGANFFDTKGVGNIKKLCVPIQKRLRNYGFLRGGQYFCPTEMSVGREYFCLTPLTRNQSLAFVRDILFEISDQVSVYRKTITESGKLVVAGKNNKRLTFAAKGELLSQYERQMILDTGSAEMNIETDFVAFQGGKYGEGERNGRSSGNGWTSNGVVEWTGPLDVRASWIRYPNVNACDLDADLLREFSDEAL